VGTAPDRAGLLDGTQLSRHYFYDYRMGVFLLGPLVAALWVPAVVGVLLWRRRRARLAPH